MKINKNNPWTWVFICLAALIVIPQITPMTLVGPVGDTADYDVLYKDSPFGYEIRKVYLDNGFTYVKQYQWYHLESLLNIAGIWQPHNIYGISSDSQYLGTTSASSNMLWLTCYTDSDPVPIYLKQQNDLDFSDSNNWFFDGKTTAKASRVAMYKGMFDEDVHLDPYTVSCHDEEYIEGPFQYGETWTSTLHFYPYVNPHPMSVDFTIQETLYADTWNFLVDGYDTDRAWVHIAVQKSPEDAEESGIGTITVKITDELLPYSAYVQMYRDGSEVGDPEYVSEDGKDFSLQLNHYYRFVVIPPDGAEWTTWAYDAVPQQSGYDYNIGDVYLDAQHNVINYIVAGNDKNTEGDAFDNSGVLPDYSYVWDIFDDDPDGESHEWWEYLLAILFGIALLGIPLILVGILAFSGYKAFLNPGSANITINLDEIKRKVKRS